MNASEPERRWFYPKPAWLVYFSLATTGFLFLSERYRWFAFNQHKGWTVLIAVAAVIVVFLLLLLWWLAALLLRWRFQFRIRSMLLFVLAVALPCSWLTVAMKNGREQRDAIREMHIVRLWDSSESEIGYDYEFDAGNYHTPTRKISGLGVPMWLRTLFTDDFFADVIIFDANASVFSDKQLKYVRAFPRLKVLFLWDTRITDEGLAYVSDMTELEELTIDCTNVTDAGLEHLVCLHRLKYLELCESKVSEQGVSRLRQTLPNCKILR